MNTSQTMPHIRENKHKLEQMSGASLYDQFSGNSGRAPWKTLPAEE